MTEAPKSHVIALTRGAARILAQVLAAPGLLTEVHDLYRAGQINEDHLLQADEAPKMDEAKPTPEQIAAYKAWTAAAHEPFSLTEKRRDTAKKAVSAAIAKGMLPGSMHTNVLLRELGLSPEE